MGAAGAVGGFKGMKYKYTFRVHVKSGSLDKSGEGVEMEIRFYIITDGDYTNAYRTAILWYENIRKKNPSIRMMNTDKVSCVMREEIE